jgi:hypothetical protein
MERRIITINTVGKNSFPKTGTTKQKQPRMLLKRFGLVYDLRRMNHCNTAKSTRYTLNNDLRDAIESFHIT